MYSDTAQKYHRELLATLSQRRELEIAGPQGAEVVTLGESGEMRSLINLCSNNYLGLANHPQLLEVAVQALRERGIGMSSVRFICGTQDIHRQLESELAEWLGTDDAILYSSCFDANAGLFEALLGEEDAIISDALNHASLIDGIRLCKARRHRFANRDLGELEACLKKARAESRLILVVTDGVFSMDGTYADVAGICDLAEQYGALVFVDDSHAIGFVGDTGAGTPERAGCQQRVDLVSGTFGKALGGASGGYVAGRQDLIDLLRKRSRPYLFSNSLAPSLVAVAREAIRIARTDRARRDHLWALTGFWRRALSELGFPVAVEPHPINPVILCDREPTERAAAYLLEKGVYAVAFSYPVVPKGQARIRTQISAGLSQQQLVLASEVLADCRVEKS